MTTHFKGIYPAVVTPFAADGTLDTARLSEFIDFLIGNGVHGIVPLGSTGEYYALTDQERETVIRVSVETVAGRVPIIVGTNAAGTAQVIKYSQQAEKLGADGLLLAAPFYALPGDNELVEHFKTVNDNVNIPIMLYNYPARTGVDMTPELVERMAEFDKIRYIKESTGDATRVTRIIGRCHGKIKVFCGCDTLPVESFMMGAVGWVGGIANILPEIHVRLYRLAVDENNLKAAVELFYTMLPLLSLIEGGGHYTQMVKAGCEIIGHPVGIPRQPLLPATQNEIVMLNKLIKAL
jgi:4-hydroxy-tetrahydrodipicolinate synthase